MYVKQKLHHQLRGYPNIERIVIEAYLILFVPVSTLKGVGDYDMNGTVEKQFSLFDLFFFHGATPDVLTLKKIFTHSIVEIRTTRRGRMRIFLCHIGEYR